MALKLDATKHSHMDSFQVGDTVRVMYKIREGDKTREQPYEGIVIGIKGSDVSKTFTVRKIGDQGVGVERIFPVNSPNISKLSVLKKGKVRRAKLFYLRDKVGKSAERIKVRN
ncbi:50S ribosomal protein L19 [Patescibacteria group bacterium]|nr:50S ribosomal protein L19 [Patescibacteria group bacterium]